MEWINIRADMAKYFIQDVRGFTSPEAILNLCSNSQELYVGPIDWHWGSDAEINVKLELPEN